MPRLTKTEAAQRVVREIEDEWSRLQRKFESGVLVNFNDVYNRLSVAREALFQLQHRAWTKSEAYQRIQRNRKKREAGNK